MIDGGIINIFSFGVVGSVSAFACPPSHLLPLYGGRANNVCGISIEHATGTLAAGADLRGEAYAIAR